MHGKKGSDCAYPHPPMCFKYIKRGPLPVILCIQSYAAHHLYLESVIVIAVILITLLVLLGLII